MKRKRLEQVRNAHHVNVKQAENRGEKMFRVNMEQAKTKAKKCSTLRRTERKNEVIPGNPVPENRAKTGRKTDRNRNAKNHIKNEEKKKKKKG